MNPVIASSPMPPIETSTDTVVMFPVLTIVLAIVGYVLIRVVLRRITPGQRATAVMFAAVLGGMFLVILMAKVRMSVSVTESRNGIDQKATAITAIAPKLEETPAESVVPSATTEPSIEVNALPTWIQQAPNADSSSGLVVVRSGRFATKEEAEEHAFDEAGKLAARHFRSLDPTGHGTSSPFHRELVRQTAIKQRFDEISRHNFGTIKDHPMHQVWLQVELTPKLGEKLAEPWRGAAVEARLLMLGTLAGWITGVSALLAFALRLDAARNGRGRAVICAVVVATAVGSLLVLA